MSSLTDEERALVLRAFWGGMVDEERQVYRETRMNEPRELEAFEGIARKASSLLGRPVTCSRRSHQDGGCDVLREFISYINGVKA